MKNAVNSTPQNLENIKALALYVEASVRLVAQHREVCNRMLQQYVKEEYGITLKESVIPFEDESKGTSYFAPDYVHYHIYGDDRLLIILRGTEYFPGRRESKISSFEFDDVAFNNVKKGIIYRVEDLPVLLGKE